MGGQKNLQGTPSDHAAVGLESGLPLEPIEIVIEPCHEGQRQPYIDNGRRLPWRVADTALCAGVAWTGGTSWGGTATTRRFAGGIRFSS